jgi:hypothetical protein
MQAYDGVPTESEHADIDRLRRRLSSSLLSLVSAEPKAAVLDRHRGRVSDEGSEARVDGIDVRIPWAAVLAFAATSNVVVLAIGRLFVPIARSFFPGEVEWQTARVIVERNVPGVPSSIPGASVWKTVLLWVAVLLVIVIAWHFV